MKKIISIFLVLALCFSFPMSAMAYSTGNLNSVTTISTASGRGAAVKNDGSLWMWGSFTTPRHGANGGILMGLQKSPVKIMDGVLSVSCTDYRTAVIKKDHSLWMWGFDTDGELGMGKNGFEVFSPTKVMDDVAAVNFGGTHTAVIKTDGSLWMFGSNEEGQIGNNRAGNGTMEDNFYGPYPIQTIPVKIMDNVVSVSCGSDFTAAIKDDGSLWFWGKKQQYTPVKIMDNVASVSCGISHYAVVKTDGSLWTCGWNMSGCLGFGTDEIYCLDTPEKLMDNVSSVYCGDDITAVIKNDGSLWVWGTNYYCLIDADSSRNIGTPTKKIDNCKAVAVDSALAAILRNDGALYTWGAVDFIGNGGKGGGGFSKNSERSTQLKPVKILDNVAFPGGISSVTVPDVPSAWAKTEVEAAVSSGIVPENLQKNYVKPVSRGKVAELFINLVEETYDTPIDEILEEKGVEINEDVFSDTSDKNVLAANALGIINGTGNNKFSPNGTLTRAQVAAIINRTAKVLGIDTEGYSHNFTDVSSHWVDSELGWPVEMGIINGTGNNKFSPDAELTTEQTILIVYRALNALE